MTLKMEIILILLNRILPFPNETNWEIPSRLNVSILIKKFERRLIYEIFSFIDLKRECQKIIPITDKVSDVFSQRISSFGWTSQMIWWVIGWSSHRPFYRPSILLPGTGNRKYLIAKLVGFCNECPFFGETGGLLTHKKRTIQSIQTNNTRKFIVVNSIIWEQIAIIKIVATS